MYDIVRVALSKVTYIAVKMKRCIASWFVPPLNIVEPIGTRVPQISYTNLKQDWCKINYSTQCSDVDIQRYVLYNLKWKTHSNSIKRSTDIYLPKRP